MYSIRRCTVVCLKLVYLFTNIGNVNNKHCSQYSDVTSLLMVVGLSVDLLSPACVSHQGLLGNPNLTVAQILWILHIFPLMLGRFVKNDEKKFSSSGDFFCQILSFC